MDVWKLECGSLFAATSQRTSPRSSAKAPDAGKKGKGHKGGWHLAALRWSAQPTPLRSLRSLTHSSLRSSGPLTASLRSLPHQRCASWGASDIIAARVMSVNPLRPVGLAEKATQQQVLLRGLATSVCALIAFARMVLCRRRTLRHRSANADPGDDTVLLHNPGQPGVAPFMSPRKRGENFAK